MENTSWTIVLRTYRKSKRIEICIIIVIYSIITIMYNGELSLLITKYKQKYSHICMHSVYDKD